jgi:hypothetical protein
MSFPVNIMSDDEVKDLLEKVSRNYGRLVVCGLEHVLALHDAPCPEPILASISQHV